VAVLLLLVAAVGILLAQGLLGSLNFFKTVDEAVAQRHELGTREFRLEGMVKKHSVTRTSRGADFVMTGSSHHAITVHEVGAPPQLFRANIPVVVVGHFASESSNLFLAHQIMVKHSASYIAAHPGRVKAPDGTKR
jgi:cytochrome c-type biogenesis protein CcmE